MKRVITISREFGSGGRTIGRMVAQHLGYAFYDEELVNRVAERSGLSPEFIKERGEYATSRHSLLFSLATAQQFSLEGLSTMDRLYIEQTRIIEELAEKGGCVIVGRCADYILRDREDTLHVFILGNEQDKAQRIVEKYGKTEKSPKKRLEEKDQKRKVYYKNYTGRTWGLAKNYDLCLNSSVLGIDTCARLILKAAEQPT